MWHISCTAHYGEGSSLAAPDITLFLTLHTYPVGERLLYYGMGM